MTVKFIFVLAAFIATSVVCDDYEEVEPSSGTNSPETMGGSIHSAYRHHTAIANPPAKRGRKGQANYYIGGGHVQQWTLSDPAYKQEHCIKITPVKEKQLKYLLQDIGDFLTDLTDKYEDIDIRYVRFDVESHSEDETEEKDMIVKLNINDCKEQGKPQLKIEEENNIKELNNGHPGMDMQINNESYNVGVDESNSANNDYQTQDHGTSYQENVIANPSVDNNDSEYKEEKGSIYAGKNFVNTDSQRQNQLQAQQETSADHFNQNHRQTAVRMPRPTVTFLQLPENGQEMIDFLESRKKKKMEPVWVYMLEEGDKKEFVVFNK